MNKRQLGGAYEKRAAEYLTKMGYRIVCKNFRNRVGEIDLVAQHQGYLVFVEVKYRSNEQSGLALEAVNKRKQQKIVQVAKWYLMVHRVPEDMPVRFDVIAFDGESIQLIQDAFWA